MALDFPSSPTVGQTFTGGGVTYTWSGQAWEGGTTLDNKVSKSGDTMSGRLGIGAPVPTEHMLHVQRAGPIGTPPTWSASDVALLENGAGNAVMQIFTANTGIGALGFADPEARSRGAVSYFHTTDTLALSAGGFTFLNGTATKVDIPVGTASTSPTTGALTVVGGLGVGAASFFGGELTVKGNVSGGYGRMSVDDDGGSFNSAFALKHAGVRGWDILYNQSLNRLSFDPVTPATASVYVSATPVSNSAATGALTVAGGIGVGGNVSVGTTVSAPGYANTILGVQLTNYGAAFFSAGSGNATLSVNNSGASTWNVTLQNGGVIVGNIATSPTNTSYNTTSDGRLKEDLQSFDAGRIIDQTEVYDFRWKEVGERSYGIIAQQAVEVYPQAVNHNEKEDWWGIDYSKYVPVLLQELKAVRARLAELEGKLGLEPKHGV